MADASVTAVARVRRSDPNRPGYSRRRRGTGFEYLDERGRRIDDRDEVDRIRSLAIPPAWEEVWISPDPRGHIQAVGTDAAGRRQYRYHDAWRVGRDRRKHERIAAFAERLPALRERVARDLARRGMPRERVLAAAVRLLDRAFFRVGGESYAEQNGSYGLATIRKHHVTVRGDTIVFDYVAKGGVRRIQRVGDPELATIVRALLKRPNGGHELLAWKEGGRWRDVRSADINAYLKEHMGDDVSAKDFRTWHATVLAAVLLAERDAEATSRTSRRKLVTAAIRDVAGFLGNTPAVARSSYVDPRVVDRFLDGETIASDLAELTSDDLGDPDVQASLEAAVVSLLEGARRRRVAAAA